MKVVDCWEVQVFLVPAKQSLPWPHVAVRCGYSFQVDANRFAENGVEMGQIPGVWALIHEGVQNVCSVEGRGEDNVLPELC